MKVNGKQVELATRQTIKEFLISLKLIGTVAIRMEWRNFRKKNGQKPHSVQMIK